MKNKFIIVKFSLIFKNCLDLTKPLKNQVCGDIKILIKLSFNTMNVHEKSQSENTFIVYKLI